MGAILLLFLVNAISSYLGSKLSSLRTCGRTRVAGLGFRCH